MRWLRKVGVGVTFAVVGVWACSAKEVKKGQIMLAFSTDVSVPDDLDQLTVIVSSGSHTERRDFPLGKAEARIPATMDIVA
jgi:hypothetical protein